jgi:hypothetical protein
MPESKAEACALSAPRGVCRGGGGNRQLRATAVCRAQEPPAARSSKAWSPGPTSTGLLWTCCGLRRGTLKLLQQDCCCVLVLVSSLCAAPPPPPGRSVMHCHPNNLLTCLTPALVAPKPFTPPPP